MLRLLAALLVLLLALPVGAAPLPPQSRWTVSSMQGVDAISVAGRKDSGILALANDGRLWRSLDGAKTWNPLTVPFGGASNYGTLLPFAVGSPHDSRTWIVNGWGGVFVTRDAGETWAPVNHGSGTMVAFGATPNLLYSAPRAADGFLGSPGTPPKISFDAGATWKALADAPARLSIRAVAPSLSDVGVIYMWGPNGVVRSDDQGAAWRDVTPTEMPASTGALLGLAVDALDADIVYANAFANLDRGIYTSRDGGKTWIRGPLEWIVNVAADPAARGRAFAFAFDATVYETRDGGLTWARAEGVQLPGETPTTSGPPWMNAQTTSYYRPSFVGLFGGRRIALSVGYGALASVDLTEGALALGSDLWWNPAAPGTGLTITQHPSNQVFMVWYTYDAAGKQVWRVMPGGAWNDRVMTGAIYETDGPPYFQGTFDAARVKLTPVGIATIDFRDHDNATLVHGNGSGVVHSTTAISRMQFGDLTRFTAENFSDIWYNASESGWGLGISQQGDRIFATWYVYDESGEPMWIIMPDSVIQTEFVGVIARSVAQGDVYTTRGNPGGGYTSTKVGTARLSFRTSNSADLEYTAFGRSSTVQVTRIPF